MSTWPRCQVHDRHLLFSQSEQRWACIDCERFLVGEWDHHPDTVSVAIGKVDRSALSDRLRLAAEVEGVFEDMQS